MKDYRVIVKVRNARLLRAIEAAGFSSMPKFAATIGINYVSLNDLLNMTCSPLNAHGEVRGYVEKIIEYLGKPFDELFSEQQCEALTTNKSEKDIGAEAIFALLSQRDSDPSSSIENQQTSELITNVIADLLNPKERMVIHERYGMTFDGETKSYDEIGELLDLSRERVRQIEKKAMNKLRLASSVRKLAGFA